MKNSTSTHQTFKNPQQALIRFFATTFGILVLASLALSTFLFQKQMRETSQDTRSQASSNGSSPMVFSSPEDGLVLPPKREVVVNLLADSRRNQYSGIQLQAVVTTDFIVVDPNDKWQNYPQPAIESASQNLQIAAFKGAYTVEKTEKTATGKDHVFLKYSAQVILVPKLIATPFFTNGAEPILRVRFTPYDNSPINLNFEATGTRAILYQTEDNYLTIPATIVFNPRANVTPTPTPVPTQCTYSYSNWSDCVSGWQTRTYTLTPAGCTGTPAASLQELVRACGTTQSTYLNMYTYEACWNNDSNGISTYIIWSKDQFANVSWIDISPNNDFQNYAHKYVGTGATPLYGNYFVTDGTGFKWNNDAKSTFNFSPGITYFIRLYNGTHSQVTTYYVPKCAGTGGVTYKQCNESCNSNGECASNLTCYQNKCRQVDNVTSEVCVLPPDNGLNRICNEYCADTRECATGYSCWWNRCRNPKNLENISCAAPKKVVVNTTTTTKGSAPTENLASCNEACSTNRDCDSDLRCYQQHCRLVTNPESTICSTKPVKDAQATVSSAASISATIAPTSGAELVDDFPTPPATNNKSVSIWQSIGAFLAARWIVIVIGLLILAALFILVPLFGGSAPPAAIRPMPKPVAQAPTPVRNTPVSPAAPMSTNRVLPTRPVNAAPAQQPVVQSPPIAQRPPAAVSPTLVAQAPAPAPSSQFGKPINSNTAGMMERLQERGVKPPGTK